MNLTNATRGVDGGVTYYIALEVLVAAASIVGNLLVIGVFVRFATLRTPSNYYILSLAVADFLVGLLGIPFAILTSVGLPHDFYGCLFMNSLLMLLCTGSILSLLALTSDRCWSISSPLGYKKNISRKISAWIIAVLWVLSTLIGLLPLFGWNRGRPNDSKCLFLEVMDLRYLLFIYFGTIILPTIIMGAIYGKIYLTVKQHLRYVSEQLPTGARSKQINNKREVKTAKSVMIIVFLFVLSWIPLYTLNAVMFFCSDCNISSHLFNFSIILSHLNSAWNPLLYAWGLKGFQKAIMRILCPWKVVANDRSLNESRRASNVTRLATFSTCNNGNLYS